MNNPVTALVPPHWTFVKQNANTKWTLWHRQDKNDYVVIDQTGARKCLTTSLHQAKTTLGD